MFDIKKDVILNIEKAVQRRDACIKKTPNDISSIRYWVGYITALESIVNVLPDFEQEGEIQHESNN